MSCNEKSKKGFTEDKLIQDHTSKKPSLQNKNSKKPKKGKLKLLGALNEDGNPVDWWFIYKVSSKSKSDKPVTGTEYLYYDSKMAKGKMPLTLSSTHIDTNGALVHTLNQLFGDRKGVRNGIGWFFYNDENPGYTRDKSEKEWSKIKKYNKNPVDLHNYKNPNTGNSFKVGEVNSSRGHTKGVLAFDQSTDSGFWLIHSAPKFSWPIRYFYPITSIEEAQTYLCISLKDTTTESIAKQMYEFQQPNVYAAANIPKTLTNSKGCYRISLLNNKVQPKIKPNKSSIAFNSRDGLPFISMAKNKKWHKDFYNDLVGPELKLNIEVETWEHGKIPGSKDDDKKHSVRAMKGVDLNPIGYKISWSEAYDHGKLAISDPLEKGHVICVGDINFTIAQEKRGGGTVAFRCDPLWKGLSEILSDKVTSAKKIKKKHYK